MTVAELQRALDERLDVEESEVADLLASTAPEVRLLASRAVSLTRLRQALAASSRLAREQAYNDQSTLTVIQRLAEFTDIDEPYIETLKQLGLRAAAAGQVEIAMRLLQHAVQRSFATGQRRDERSRRALAYMHDREINEALQQLSGHFAPPTSRYRGTPDRLSIVASALQDEDGPSIVTARVAELFRDNGFEVEIVSTEMAPSDSSKIAARTRAKGFAIIQAAGATYESKIRSVLDHYQAHPVSAIYYSASGIDHVAKLLGCMQLAPVQVWENKGMEAQVGRYDRVFQSVSREQESKTYWPGRSVFLGHGVVSAEEIDVAKPLSRSSLGLPDDAVLLATFGRMEKCATPEYMRSVGEILRLEPSAWLVLAGRDGFDAVATLGAYFKAHGVGDRVRYLGPRQDEGPSLLKTVDVYCDTAPWPGGQSLMDAMQAGLPIVAFRAESSSKLDPLGGGAFSAYAEALLDGVCELAGAGDDAAYVRIARALVADPALRREVGARVRDKAVTECSFSARMVRASSVIRELIAARNSEPHQ